jgi:hypothetical protein
VVLIDIILFFQEALIERRGGILTSCSGGNAIACQTYTSKKKASQLLYDSLDLNDHP